AASFILSFIWFILSDAPLPDSFPLPVVLAVGQPVILVNKPAARNKARNFFTVQPSFHSICHLGDATIRTPRAGALQKHDTRMARLFPKILPLQELLL